jgi:hypothetical protein
MSNKIYRFSVLLHRPSPEFSKLIKRVDITVSSRYIRSGSPQTPTQTKRAFPMPSRHFFKKAGLLTLSAGLIAGGGIGLERHFQQAAAPQAVEEPATPPGRTTGGIWMVDRSLDWSKVAPVRDNDPAFQAAVDKLVADPSENNAQALIAMLTPAERYNVQEALTFMRYLEPFDGVATKTPAELKRDFIRDITDHGFAAANAATPEEAEARGLKPALAPFFAACKSQADPGLLPVSGDEVGKFYYCLTVKQEAALEKSRPPAPPAPVAPVGELALGAALAAFALTERRKRDGALPPAENPPPADPNKSAPNKHRQEPGY